MKKNIYIIIAIVIIIVFGIIIYNINNKEIKNSNSEVNIVTTFYPVNLIVKNIVKDVNNVNIINITESTGGCVHDYELNPNDVKTIEKSNGIVINGAGMEHFVDDIKNNSLKIIDSSVNTKFDVSNHIWMDIDNYIMQINNIEQGLISVDEINKDLYIKNANEYIEEVNIIKEKFDAIEDSSVNIAIMHDSFKYYEQKNKFIVSASLISGHEGNISANDMKNFIEDIKSTNTLVLLVDNETMENKKELINNIVQETNVKVFVIDLIVDNNDDVNTYINKMSENINVLKEAIEYGK